MLAVSSLLAEQRTFRRLTMEGVLRRSVVAGVAIHCCVVLQQGARQRHRALCGGAARDETLERAEWAAGLSAGAIVQGVGALAVRRAGARPVLAVGFLVMPSFFVTLALREQLVLLRATHPELHESAAVSIAGALPLLALPGSLRALLAPLFNL